MTEECSRDVHHGWLDFIRDYALVARTLLLHYFPAIESSLDDQVQAVFAAAHAQQNAWFKQLQFNNEREFAMAFRELVLALGREASHWQDPNLSADVVTSSLDGFPLIEKQIFWAFLKGWTVPEVSAILLNASTTAIEMKATADARIENLLAATSPGISAQGLAIAVSATARRSRTSDCLSWKTFNNIINGQISWHDRESAERHINTCLNCLDAFTSFSEMIWLEKTTEPASQPTINHIVEFLHLPKQKGALARFFSRAS